MTGSVWSDKFRFDRTFVTRFDHVIQLRLGLDEHCSTDQSQLQQKMEVKQDLKAHQQCKAILELEVDRKRSEIVLPSFKSKSKTLNGQ